MPAPHTSHFFSLNVQNPSKMLNLHIVDFACLFVGVLYPTCVWGWCGGKMRRRDAKTRRGDASALPALACGLEFATA